MEDGEFDSDNVEQIRKIKDLFFDPKCGGDRLAEKAVLKMVDGYRASFEYLNKVVPADAQCEIESEADEEYWITPKQLKRQITVLLTSGHADDVSRDKFRAAAKEKGFTIHYEMGISPDVSETYYRARMADHLADYYVSQVMTERAIERGGR